MSDIEQFDAWVTDDSDVAALVMREWLQPVEGKDAVVFPPTYPGDQGKPTYNIDRFDDGSSVCQIDSVGSQANRMEPIFKRAAYRHLVPQVVVKAGTRQVHLLDAGHRAADAILRFSEELGPQLHEAFRIYCDEGNAEPLARIAPTSIVFGAWDSRATQAKLPRIVRSVVRAYDVRELHRSAQYSTIAGEILDDGEAQVTTTGPKAELGLAHVPSVHAHGGVRVLGDIRRDAIVNLSALRSLSVSSDPDATLNLRRYILGLALVSFTAPLEISLREGCELVPDLDRPAEWKLVRHDGSRSDAALLHQQALAFATAAAASFGVAAGFAGHFSPDLTRKVLALKEEDRKALLRRGPVTPQRVQQLEHKSAKGHGKGSAEDGQE